MRILIAGGAGYIGSALIPKLLERGYQIDVIDLLWFGNYLPAEVKILNKDIFDLTETELKDYNQVMFLAGLSNDPMAEFPRRKTSFIMLLLLLISRISPKEPGLKNSFMPVPVQCMVIQ